MKIHDRFRRLIAKAMRIRLRPTSWVIGIVAAVVFVCGICWQQVALLGCGAVVLCLVIRTVGDEVTNRRSPRRSSSNRKATPAPAPTSEGAASDDTPIHAGALRALDESQSQGGTDALIEQMLSVGRYALLLRPETSAHLNSQQLTRAIRALDEAMGLVPDGKVWLGQLAEQAGNGSYPEDIDPRVVKNGLGQVAALYLDRCAVTNADFQRFVDDGGYEKVEFWSEEALPALLDFVDQTGLPGPRFWSDGVYPAGDDRLPVVGVSWYEAWAFARWVGKRLPTDAEWTKAGAWPVESAPGRIAQRRYPWGESFDVRRANIWGAGLREPAAVDEFSIGSSVGGIHQMIGNVWEWTATPLCNSAPPALHVPDTMMSIRGGAFDTYFENQATCHYQTGELPLARRANIGFRLAISMSALESEATEPTVENTLPVPADDAVESEESTAC